MSNPGQLIFGQGRPGNRKPVRTAALDPATPAIQSADLQCQVTARSCQFHDERSAKHRRKGSRPRPRATADALASDAPASQTGVASDANRPVQAGAGHATAARTARHNNLTGQADGVRRAVDFIVGSGLSKRTRDRGTGARARFVPRPTRSHSHRQPQSTRILPRVCGPHQSSLAAFRGGDVSLAAPGRWASTHEASNCPSPTEPRAALTHCAGHTPADGEPRPPSASATGPSPASDTRRHSKGVQPGRASHEAKPVPPRTRTRNADTDASVLACRAAASRCPDSPIPDGNSRPAAGRPSPNDRPRRAATDVLKIVCKIRREPALLISVRPPRKKL